MQDNHSFFVIIKCFYSNSSCYFLEYYHVIFIFVPEIMSVEGCRGQEVPYFIGKKHGDNTTGGIFNTG